MCPAVTLFDGFSGKDTPAGRAFAGCLWRRWFLFVCWWLRHHARGGFAAEGLTSVPGDLFDVTATRPWSDVLAPLLFPSHGQMNLSSGVFPWLPAWFQWLRLMGEADTPDWMPGSTWSFSWQDLDPWLGLDCAELYRRLKPFDAGESPLRGLAATVQAAALCAPLADFLERGMTEPVRRNDGAFFTDAAVVDVLCERALGDFFDSGAALAAMQPTGPSFFRACAEGLTDVVPLPRPNNRCAPRVCDPAVGGGAFLVGMLLALLRRWQTELESPVLVPEIQAGVACLFGLDVQPAAVAICRLRLLFIAWLTGADLDETGAVVRRQIRCGDALDPCFYRADAAVLAPDWPGEAGFDLVVGNPPYVDSERMVQQGAQGLRRRLTQNMTLTRGNWDLYIAFFEMGFRLLQQQGVLTYLTPDKWLAKPFGTALRTFALARLAFLCEAGRDLFRDAKVDAVFVGYSGMVRDTIEVGVWYQNRIQPRTSFRKTNLREPFRLDYLFSPDLAAIQAHNRLPHRLGQWVRIENACTTADAYALKPLLREGEPADAGSETVLRLVNTGTLAKFHHRWGQRKCTYLKHKYQYPVVDRTSFETQLPQRYVARALAPKLIIKGLTLLDAAVDFRGGLLPAKSTLLLFTEVPETLSFWALLLNSRRVRGYICERYRGSSYNGGVNFTCDMLRDLPVPVYPDASTCAAAEVLVRLLCCAARYDVSPMQATLLAMADALVDVFYETGCDAPLWRDWCAFVRANQPAPTLQGVRLVERWYAKRKL